MTVRRRGNYRLAEQVGDCAVFASIEISITDAESGNTTVTFAPSMANNQPANYLSAIHAGVNHGLSIARCQVPQNVVVQRLETNPVDTTTEALMFASCMATLDGFGVVPLSKPLFEPTTRSFVFPLLHPG